MSKPKKEVMPAAFWAWMDAIRRERGLSDTQVANLSGIAQSVISKARTNERPIGADALTRIADGLHFPRIVVLRLAGWLPDDEAPAPVDIEIRELWGRLSADDREEVVGLMKLKVARYGRPSE